jgi:hypothetical protein
MEAFYNYVQEPYKIIPQKEGIKKLKGNLKKLNNITKQSEKNEIRKDIMENIDIISASDSLVFLENMVNDLREDRGSLWQEMRDIKKELEKGLPLLTEEVWFDNLGAYARTLYVKTEDGKVKVSAKESINKDGIIDRSAFKRKLTDTEWGANALLFEGKTVAEIEKYSEQELTELGVNAKEKYGWTFQADYILAKTFTDLSKAYATLQFQKQIVSSPSLFTLNQKEAESLKFIPVSDILPKSVKKDTRLGPLNNGYIHPGLKDELKAITFGTTHDSIFKIFQEPLSWWKAFKVAGNPASVVRNYISGSTIQTDLGGYPVWTPSNAKTYFESLVSYFKKDDLYKKLRDNGQYGSDYYAVEIDPSEMNRIIKRAESSNNPMESYTTDIFSFISHTVKDAKDVFNYYGHIDHIQRTYMASAAMKDGASVEQAIHFANKWQLDYRFVPQIISGLREGIGGWAFPFLSFYALMAPRIAEVVITRPWVLAKYPAIIAAFNMASQSILGDDDDEKIEAAKPDFLKDMGYVITMPTRDSNGDYVFLNLDYVFPFGGPKSAFMDFDMITLMAKNPGLVSIMLSIANNYDSFTGSKIFNETDLEEIKEEKISNYVIRNLGPGVITHAMNIYNVSKNKKGGFPVEKEKNVLQPLLRGVGVSVYSGGYNEAWWKMYNLREEMKEIKKAMVNFSKNENISDEEKARMIPQFKEELLIRSDKMQELREIMSSLK